MSQAGIVHVHVLDSVLKQTLGQTAFHWENPNKFDLSIFMPNVFKQRFQNLYPSFLVIFSGLYHDFL
jgi:hypothetical protein